MRTMDTMLVLRYTVIVTLLGIDQPEATVSTVLPIREIMKMMEEEVDDLGGAWRGRT